VFASGEEISTWQRWLHHPESLWIRRVIFQIHLWVGAGVGLYIMLMSISGSLLVYRDELSKKFSVEWIVNLHANLLTGVTGRKVNGIGACCLLLLSLTGAITWWPGINNWRRSLTVKWNSHWGRFTWDLHGALGFWCFLFVLMWGLSGLYLCFPQPYDALFALLDPKNRFADQTLLWFSLLHFGRFTWFTKALWTLLGLVPAVLATTGIFLCCHRMIHGPSQHRENEP